MNPVFAQAPVLTYMFESLQRLRFRVVDVDAGGDKTQKLGEAETTMAAVVSKKDGLVLPLKGTHKQKKKPRTRRRSQGRKRDQI